MWWVGELPVGGAARHAGPEEAQWEAGEQADPRGLDQDSEKPENVQLFLRCPSTICWTQISLFCCAIVDIINYTWLFLHISYYFLIGVKVKNVYKLFLLLIQNFLFFAT